MSAVLVTGAAGFIGSHVCDRLLSRGSRVVALDNFDDYYDPLIKRRNIADALRNPGYTLIEADVRNRTALDAVFTMHRIDTVIHLAARAGVRPSIFAPELYYDTNVIGTLRLLEAMRTAGVNKLVFASSSSVYGNQEKVPFSESDPVDTPISPYAASKKAGELLCHTYAHLHGIDAWCLRFFTAYGPRQRPEMAIATFLAAARDGAEVTVHGDGTMMRDYTYVDDIVDGVLVAAERVRGYEVINIGGAHAYALSELLDVVDAVTGVTLRRRTRPVPQGDVRITAADTAKASMLLEFRPRVPLTEGVARQWRWMQA